MLQLKNAFETDHLILCHLTTEDAAFILELLNDPGWLRFIGDRGVRTLDDARRYILNGPVKSYQQSGFGLYLVKLKENETPIGMCGLIKREELDDVDIGFAFLPQFTGRGYAYEAAAATLHYGYTVLGLKHIVAITDPDNERSIRLLQKLGLRLEKTIRLSAGGPVSNLFVPDQDRPEEIDPPMGTD